MVRIKQYKSASVCLYVAIFLARIICIKSILSLFWGLPKLLIMQSILRILSTDQGGESHDWQGFISFNDNFASAGTGTISDIFSYLEWQGDTTV